MKYFEMAEIEPDDFGKAALHYLKKVFNSISGGEETTVDLNCVNTGFSADRDDDGIDTTHQIVTAQINDHFGHPIVVGLCKDALIEALQSYVAETTDKVAKDLQPIIARDNTSVIGVHLVGFTCKLSEPR